MTNKSTPILMIVFFLFGCSTTAPTKTQISNANFGNPPANYEERIKQAFEPKLIDPTSPMFKFSSPQKAWEKNYNTNGIDFGWKVCGQINSKNRAGGYTGWQTYSAFFIGDTDPIVTITEIILPTRTLPGECTNLIN